MRCTCDLQTTAFSGLQRASVQNIQCALRFVFLSEHHLPLKAVRLYAYSTSLYLFFKGNNRNEFKSNSKLNVASFIPSEISRYKLPFVNGV